MASYEYGPYGEVLTSSGPMAVFNPILYASRYTDNESALVYFGGRYYSPDWGRWLSPDPMGEEGGLNLYGFNLNDPVNYFDPDGFMVREIGAGVVSGSGNFGIDTVAAVAWVGATGRLVSVSATRISVEMMQIGANTLGLGHPLMDSALDSALIGLRREESALSGFRSGIWDSADQLKWSLAEEVSGAFGVDPCSRAFRTTANLTDIAASVLVPPGALLAKGAIRSAALSRASVLSKSLLNQSLRHSHQAMRAAQGMGKAIKSGTSVRIVGSADSAGRSGLLALGNRGGIHIGKGNVGSTARKSQGRVFWSGGDSMREAAESWAKSNGTTTLEMTATGQRLTQTTKNLDWLTEARPMWGNASGAFAKGAVGDVHVFQWASPHKLDNMTVWREFEFPVLQQQGNKIIYHLKTADGWIVTP